MIIRIPLTDDNSSVTEIYDNNPSTPPDTASVIPDDTVKFSLRPVEPSQLGSYYSARYSHAVLMINVNVPDSDLPLVNQWVSDTPPTFTPGETLRKRMSEAVNSALSNFYSFTRTCTLFTSPFKIGFALRQADGSYADIKKATLLTPASVAPLLAIRDARLSGNTLSVLTEIMATPTELSCSVQPFKIPETTSARPTHIAIFATRQTPLVSGAETVTSIRSAEIFGERVPIWNYSRQEEDAVIGAAQADTSYRIIAELSIEEVTNGTASLRLPYPLRNLNEWDSLPSFSGKVFDDGHQAPSRIMVTTKPLDLNRPEEYKKVRGVALRGIFDRTGGEEGVNFTLYGSHHRDRWHPIAKARGANMRFMRGVSFRWYRLEIDAPYPSLFEAASFEVISK